MPRILRTVAPVGRRIGALILTAVLVAACAPAAPTAPTPALPPTAVPAALPTATSAPAALTVRPTEAPKPATQPTVAAPVARSGDLKKVTLAYGSVSPSYMPFWAAAEKGFWRTHGLDVDLVLTESGSRAAQAVLGGSAHAGFASGTTWLGPASQGAKVKVLATVVKQGQDMLLSKPSITQPSQLRGGKIAVSTFGDVSHLTGVLMVQSLGLDADKDVTFVQIGNDAARAAALQSGAADAAPLNPTSADKLVRELGFSVLINGQEKGIAFPQVTMGTTQALFEKEPETLTAMLRGVLDGIDWIYNPANETEAKELLAQKLKVAVTDPAIDLSYRNYVPTKLYSTEPFVEREGFRYMQSFTGKFNKEMESFNVDSVLDDTLLKAALDGRKR